MPQFNFSAISNSLSRRNTRLGLWALLIILTLLIFLQRVHLSSDVAPIWTISIFNNLVSFITLYYFWFAILLILILTADNDLEAIIALLVFALVYLCFWTIAFPGARDATESYWHIRLMDYIGTTNSLPSSPSEFYEEFPNFGLLGSTIQQLCGISLIPSLEKYLSVVLLLMAVIMLYAFFKCIFINNRLSSISVLFFIFSAAVLTRVYPFQPRYLGWDLLLVCLILIFIKTRKASILNTQQGIIIFILLVVALTTTHAPSILFIVSLLLVIYFIYFISNRFLAKHKLAQFVKTESIPWLTLAILSFVAATTWQFIYASNAFEATAISIPINPGEWLSTIRDMIDTFLTERGRHIGYEMPIWANGIELFWLIFTIGIGSILGLKSLLSINKLSNIWKNITGGFIAAILFGILMVFGREGGGEYFRILYFLPLFTIPLIIKYCSKRLLYTLGLVSCIFLLSLPTFLVHNKEVPATINFTNETAAAKFLGSAYNIEGDQTVSSNYRRFDMYQFYGPEIIFGTRHLTHTSEEIDDLIAEINKNQGEQEHIYVFNKTRAEFESQYLIKDQPSEIKWDELEGELGEQTQFYSNGLVRMYVY